MRKADYAHLAAVIRTEHSRAQHEACAPQEWESRYAEGERDALETIARQFAARASVDAGSFLAACGLVP